MARITSSNISEFQETLVEWYRTFGRAFEWRRDNLSTYSYVIAEVLLQRTKADNVAKIYRKFLSSFPSWRSLYQADLHEIEAALRVLGLQRQRAVRLHRLASEMVNRRGKFPSKRADLEAMPFLGQYIANAVELLIFDRPRPLLDVNMSRLVERYFKPRVMSDIRYDPYLQNLSQRIADHKNSRIVNWAILDYAAIICRVKPRCDVCSIKKKCSYFRNTSSHLFK